RVQREGRLLSPLRRQGSHRGGSGPPGRSGTDRQYAICDPIFYFRQRNSTASTNRAGPSGGRKPQRRNESLTWRGDSILQPYGVTCRCHRRHRYHAYSRNSPANRARTALGLAKLLSRRTPRALIGQKSQRARYASALLSALAQWSFGWVSCLLAHAGAGVSLSVWPSVCLPELSCST